MPTYKTPDVYVEEISIFPPSVAEVETAVPCFIGYTEKATRLTKGDLHMKAFKVKSLVEYQQYYGGGPALDELTVTLDSSNSVTNVEMKSDFYLYDSLQLFFLNGGGKCYIISTGTYTDVGSGKTTAHFTDALEVLKKKDEPTMIVMPDATLLADTGLYDVQKAALQQCAKLMDRVLIADLKNIDPTSGVTHEDTVQSFRNTIGINSLKYGAAYTPWLRSSLPRVIRLSDIKLLRGTDTIQLESLTSDVDIKQLIANIKSANKLYSDINTMIETTSAPSSSLDERLQTLIDAYNTGISNSILIGPARALIEPLYELFQEVVLGLIDLASSLVDHTDSEYNIKTDYNQILSAENVVGHFMTLQHYHFLNTGVLFDLDAGEKTTIATALDIPTDASTNAEWQTLLDSDAAYSDYKDEYNAIDASLTGTAREKTDLAYGAVVTAFNQLSSVISQLQESADNYSLTYDGTLEDSFATYKSILSEINNSLGELPPSGAVAGLYAFVDNTRGVHKAPANVSVSGVAGLVEEIGFEEQKDLNVDVNAGKSINAIRYFTGKGILVWGARTLAGNDNEWRYISVRRFFNMVEESVKKSTYWAVFEPNDANTWVRVKAMIENYLIQKWKDGALQGATPNDAFFVKVGLGLTMTPQDVYEGRMNVEIGMAVVRPAEFIILKFSHKILEVE